MSVYSRTNAAGKKVWRYDFEFAGQRYFSDEPHFKTQAKALGAETKKRKELKRSGAGAGKVPTQMSGPRLTVGQACDRYWRDVGQHHRSASDIKRRLEICKRLIDAKKPLTEIGTAKIIDAVQTRITEETLTRYGKPSGKKVTGAGANRDIIDAFRPVFNHCASVFEEDGLVLRKVDWKRARQEERDEVVCEFSDAEVQAWEAALVAAAGKHGRDGAIECVFLHLALTYGPRQGELHFPPKAFKPDAEEGPEIEIGAYVGKGGVRRESRKDKTLHTIPLTTADAALIAPLVEHAIALRAETIWLEQNRAGDWERISYDAMRGRLLRAARKADIDEARIIHGMRHHAGERMERAGGMARVQQLLGHKQITTSRRYARGSKSALRENLDQILSKNPSKSPAQAPPSEKLIAKNVATKGR